MKHGIKLTVTVSSKPRVILSSNNKAQIVLISSFDSSTIFFKNENSNLIVVNFFINNFSCFSSSHCVEVATFASRFCSVEV